MRKIKVPVNYYRHFDADCTLAVPAEGFGGWAPAEVDFDADRTALIVMHASCPGSMEDVPGYYRIVEYLQRCYSIADTVFPPVLSACRKASVPVFHVAYPGRYYQNLPGYELTQQALAGRHTEGTTVEKIERDAVLDSLFRFRTENVYPGEHNLEDIEKSHGLIDFLPEAMPLDSEPIVENAEQLFEVCRQKGINNLIYIGFAIDNCLLSEPGGMLDMSRRGFLCSAIRQAVTAVENKETARTETAKEVALWRIAVEFGFVLDSDDFIYALQSGLGEKI